MSELPTWLLCRASPGKLTLKKGNDPKQSTIKVVKTRVAEDEIRVLDCPFSHTLWQHFYVMHWSFNFIHSEWEFCWKVFWSRYNQICTLEILLWELCGDWLGWCCTAITHARNEESWTTDGGREECQNIYMREDRSDLGMNWMWRNRKEGQV